ncbi:hypothetical protein FSP39_001734 [Pinctada imbricata]|uniref:Mitochondrial GTPase 1 n=1 Tax=Pinctada imbricata TaxID=66713 RepID=A0AA89C4T5_PINIB|nr:hypothetical protein FSP39_001734 [Pinctada imbricata]
MQRGWAQIATTLRNIDCIVEVHDARIPFSGRNPKFRDLLQVKPHILILNKADLADLGTKRHIEEKLKEQGVEKTLFSNCHQQHSKFISKQVIPSIMELIDSRPRYNRSEVNQYEIMVIGVPNVGKSTFINLMKRTHTTSNKKPLSVGAVAGVTRGVSGKVRVSFEPEIFLVDTPGILMPNVDDVETGMKLALCRCLPDHLVGEEFIVDYMLYWMNKHQRFKYVKYFRIEEPTENVFGFLSQIAKKERFIKKIRIPGKNEYTLKPDFLRAAALVLNAFRTGELGQFMLDT